MLSASPLTRPKIQIENVQLSLLFLLVPLSFATYFPFGQIIAAMSLITLGLRLVNLKGSLDKHLYTYTKGIFFTEFHDSSHSRSFDAGQDKWQQLLSLCWEFQHSAAVPVLAEEKNRLWIFRRKRLIWASS